MDTPQGEKTVIKARASALVGRATEFGMRFECSSVDAAEAIMSDYSSSLEQNSADRYIAEKWGRAAAEILTNSVGRHGDIIKKYNLGRSANEPAQARDVLDVVLLRVAQSKEGHELTVLSDNLVVPGIIAKDGIRSLLMKQRGLEEVVAPTTVKKPADNSPQSTEDNNKPTLSKAQETKSVALGFENYVGIASMLQRKYGQNGAIDFHALFGIGEYGPGKVTAAKEFLRSKLIELIETGSFSKASQLQRRVLGMYLGVVVRPDSTGVFRVYKQPDCDIKKLRKVLYTMNRCNVAEADVEIINSLKVLSGTYMHQEPFEELE